MSTGSTSWEKGVKMAGVEGRKPCHLDVPFVWEFWDTEPPGAPIFCSGL